MSEKQQCPNCGAPSGYVMIKRETLTTLSDATWCVVKEKQREFYKFPLQPDYINVWDAARKEADDLLYGEYSHDR
jgi:hypothetical protein